MAAAAVMVLVFMRVVMTVVVAAVLPVHMVVSVVMRTAGIAVHMRVGVGFAMAVLATAVCIAAMVLVVVRMVVRVCSCRGLFFLGSRHSVSCGAVHRLLRRLREVLNGQSPQALAHGAKYSIA
jgi:hypothetical protein